MDLHAGDMIEDLEPFDPEIERALRYPVGNPMHNARYIGAVLVPFLLLLPVCRWQRRERWLIVSALGTLIVCLAPPLVLSAWAVVPFMNRIQHVFAFYHQYWELMVVLIAAAGFERVLVVTDRADARRIVQIASGMAVAATGVLVLAWAFSSRFAMRDYDLQAIVRASIMVLIPSALMVQLFLYGGQAARRLLVGVVLLLAFADLTKYFFDVSHKDMEFTGTRWVKFPLAADIQARMRMAWATPDLDSGFASNIAGNMPVPNTFWPANTFMTHLWLTDLGDPSLNAIRDGGLKGPPLEFFSRAEVGEPSTLNHGGAAGQRTLWFVRPATAAATAGRGNRALRAVWREWSYNGFAFDMDAPEAGFVLVRQLADPLWRIEVDGRRVEVARANGSALAIPIEAGYHDVRMTYRPLGRRLYWPASIVLEATWVTAIVMVRRSTRRRVAA
jgi:hypothetical protein